MLYTKSTTKRSAGVKGCFDSTFCRSMFELQNADTREGNKSCFASINLQLCHY